MIQNLPEATEQSGLLKFGEVGVALGNGYVQPK
jgi:hypothetical protein